MATLKMRVELSVMRTALLELERAFETDNENAMFMALASMRQANAYFGKALTVRVNRRVAKAVSSPAPAPSGLTENQAKRLAAADRNYVARPVRCNSNEWLVWDSKSDHEVTFDPKAIFDAEWE